MLGNRDSIVHVTMFTTWNELPANHDAACILIDSSSAAITACSRHPVNLPLIRRQVHRELVFSIVLQSRYIIKLCFYSQISKILGCNVADENIVIIHTFSNK